MFSTAVFVKMGCTWQNYMTHMKPTNSKLRKRAVAMICEILDLQADAAQQLLESHNWDIHDSLIRYHADRM